MTIVWCMVPAIWSVTDKMFCHFGPFFALLPPPTPPKNPQNQNFKKMKKAPAYIINLHKCTINNNHMMYGSWDMKRDTYNFLSFWTVFTFFCHFCPFYPSSPKNQNFKKWKNCPEILSLYIYVSKIMIRWCTFPEIWCMTDRQMDRQMDGKGDI